MAESQVKPHATAVLAGGCFWCLEHDLKGVAGILDTRVGYAGGHVDNPSYKEVTTGTTGHVEAVEITYDPTVLSYKDLLSLYWHMVDPLDAGGQFCDRGEQYRAVVFTKMPEEKKAAEDMRAKLSLIVGESIVTDILPFVNFYPAEDYHQDYSEKNPTRYGFYRWGCGRDSRVREVWGK